MPYPSCCRVSRASVLMPPPHSPTFQPLGSFRDLTIDDWSNLGDSRQLSDKYSSGVSPTNLNHTWNFSDLGKCDSTYLLVVLTHDLL